MNRPNENSDLDKSHFANYRKKQGLRVKIWNKRFDYRHQNFLFYLLIAVSIAVRFPHVFKELSPYQFCDEVMWLNEVQRMVSENSFIPKNFLSGSLAIVPAFVASQLAKLIIGRNLDANELTIVTRIVLIQGSVIGAAFVYRKILRLLLKNEWIVIGGIAILLLNPSSLAFSLYWYPDHYILFPAIFFYYTIISAIVNRKSGISQWILIGVAWAILVSTKYTTLLAGVMLIPVLIAGGKNFSLQVSSFRILRKATIVFVTFSMSFLVLIYGVIFHPRKFVGQFLYNLSNYGRFKGGIQPLVFYLYTMLISPFGLVSLSLLVVGVVFVFKLNKLVGWSLISFPVLLVISLSRSGFTISRNVAVLLPITSIFLICGLQEVLSIAKKQARLLRSLIFIFVAFSLSFPLIETIAQIQKSLKQDSRVLASRWISGNIPGNSTIGNNESCSGASPVETAGLKSTRDPMMELQLDFYVFNSFWGSPLYRHYESDSDQRYFHFHRFLIDSEGNLRYSGFPLFRQHFDIADLTPKNYFVQRIFDGDGPSIVILRRLSD